MAKRRKSAPQRSHVYQQGEVRPGFSRRQAPRPQKKGLPWSWIAVGALGIVAVVAVLAYALGFIPGTATPTPGPTIDASLLHPPSATPLASPLAEPAGDGTTATIETDLGNIQIELFTESAPVAAENFINLAEAGFYTGVVFHRTIAGFMIQGGDPEGSGGGGPGYEILDDPVVGDYDRGIVAMARPAGQGGAFIPNSQGSQFFIMVAARPELASGGYSIFGRVVSGMDVVDAIVARETTPDDIAVDPVVMNRVTVARP